MNKKVTVIANVFYLLFFLYLAWSVYSETHFGIVTMMGWIFWGFTIIVQLLDSIFSWQDKRPTLYKVLYWGFFTLLVIVLIVKVTLNLMNGEPIYKP